MHPYHPFGCQDERSGHRGGDQTHAQNRAEAKNDQVDRCPKRVWNGAQDEQSDRSATCESVDETNDKRAEQWTAQCESVRDRILQDMHLSMVMRTKVNIMVTVRRPSVKMHM